MRAPPLTGPVAIGVDVGGTNLRAARVDGTGRIEGHIKRPVDRRADTAAHVLELCRELATEEIAGIGIGVPGRVGPDGAILSTGFLDLGGVPLKEMVETALSLRVVLENDGHMALVAELAIGAATDMDDVVMFTVGTGVGGAAAAGGRVLRGRGNAGQMGHLALDPAGPPCRCGRLGCTEVLASGTALARLVREAGLPDGSDVRSLFDRSSAGDAPATDALRSWARAWRDAIDTAAAMFDPDLIVLGGGLGAAAAEAVQLLAPPRSTWFEVPVVPAHLGDDAGVIGAGLRALAR